jgi:hypothetical protein
MNLLKINLILVGLLLCSMRAGALSKSEIADLDGHIILGNRKSGGKLFIFDHNQDEWTSPLWSYNTRVGVDGLSMDFNHFNDQKRVWYKNTEHILIAGNGDGIALFNLETEKFDFSYEVKVDGLSTSVHAAEILPDGNFVVADPTGANRGGANLRLIYGDNADPKILQSIAFSGIHAVVWDYERERLWVWGSKLRKYRYVSDGENSQLIQDGSQFNPPWWGSGAHDMMPMIRGGQTDQLIFNCQQGIGTFDIESESFELLYGTNSVAVNVLPDSKVVRGKGVDHNSLTGEVIYNKSEASKLYKPGTIINSKMDSWDYTGTDTMEFYKAHWFQHNTFSYGPATSSTNPPANRAPTFLSTPASTVLEGEDYSYTAAVYDTDDEDTLTRSEVLLPEWLNFDAISGLLSGTPGTNDLGGHTVTLRVNDGTVDVDQTFTIFVVKPGLPVQHLDAAVAGSVTGSPVTQWADRSGNGNHAGPAAGSVTYPSSSFSESGRPGLNVGSTNNSLELFSAADSDDWLDFTGDASGNSGFCVLVAFKCDTLNTASWNDVLGNTSSISGFGFRYSKSGAPQAYLGGASINRSGGVVEPGDTAVYGVNYNAVTGSYMFWDSKNDSAVSQSVAATNFSMTGPVTVGRTDNTGRYMIGMIGEVKVFDTVLSSEEFQAERDALVEKWISGSISGYEGWTFTNSIIGEPTDDDDGDGLDNLSEYAVSEKPTFTRTGSQWEYIHLQRNDDPNLTCRVEARTNLISGEWTTEGVTILRSNTAGAGTFYDEVTNRISATSPQAYVRLTVEN